MDAAGTHILTTFVPPFTVSPEQSLAVDPHHREKPFYAAKLRGTRNAPSTAEGYFRAFFPGSLPQIPTCDNLGIPGKNTRKFLGFGS